MRVAVVLLVLLPACQILVGDDADDGDDDYIDCDHLPVRALRDPQTGTCTPVGRVGSMSECKACGTCAPDPIDLQGRAECGWLAYCESHNEFDCVHDARCRVVFAADDRFLGCWGVAPGNLSGQGTCAGLDASACSGHLGCSAWYTARGATPIAFDHCGDAPPKTACEWAVCEPDKQCTQDCTPCDPSVGASCEPRCEATCVAAQGCDELACSLGDVCRETCLRWGPQYPSQCFASCHPFEVGSPGLCDGPITCAASPPACPAGTIAGRADGCYTGFCIPATACGGGAPGTCRPVRAADAPPACPPGTVPGTSDLGPTGYCIPLAACGSSPLGTCEPATDPGTPPACSDGSIPGTIHGRTTGACIPARQCPLLPCDTLVTEPGCAARPDCRAIDRGGDCTCTAAGCSCASRAFDRCEAAPVGPGG